MSKPQHNWDAIAAIIAALIGLLAIFVSGYTAWNVHQQTRAQVWPHLQVVFSTHQQQLLAVNPGVGPAIVRSVEVRVDGKPQRNWPHVLKALGLAKDHIHFHQSTFNGSVISPGETYGFLWIPDRTQYKQFANAALAGGRMDLQVCFCSTLGDCWQSSLDSANGFNAGGCAPVPKGDEFHD